MSPNLLHFSTCSLPPSLDVVPANVGRESGKICLMTLRDCLTSNSSPRIPGRLSFSLPLSQLRFPRSSLGPSVAANGWWEEEVVVVAVVPLFPVHAPENHRHQSRQVASAHESLTQHSSLTKFPSITYLFTLFRQLGSRFCTCNSSHSGDALLLTILSCALERK